jgi:4-hydroxy-tetrahydrodipicolinate synthase
MSTQRHLDLQGVFTALVTPFSQDGGSIDLGSVASLVDTQLRAGVAGLVACGSTGEAATLSDREYLDVVRCVKEEAKGRVAVVAGVSVSSTARAVEIARSAAEVGADALLIASPPYNKPSQAGLIAHFRAIFAAVSMPLIAYNIPGRSAVSLAPETISTLAREGIITGVKESSGSIDTIAEIARLSPASCQMVTGEDSLTFAVLAYGGTGAISASSNAMPGEFIEISRLFSRGKFAEARDLQLSLLPRIRRLFIESNPVPVKTVLALQGVIKHATVRLPLTPLSPESLEAVRKEFSL